METDRLIIDICELANEEEHPVLLARKAYSGKHFWRYSPARAKKPPLAVTDEVLERWEKTIGLKLPAAYKELFKLQNGGEPWFDTYACDGRALGLFVNSAELSPLGGEKGLLIGEVYDYVEDEGGWQEVFGPGCKMERLHVISFMYGHSVLCLDYGVKLDEALAEPEVCLLDPERDFADIFRSPSFEHFLGHLVYGGTDFYMSLHSPLGLEALAAQLTERFFAGQVAAMPAASLALLKKNGASFAFERRTSDRSGWFDFEAWYSATVDFGKLKYNIVLSPNACRSGAKLFPDSEAGYILEVSPRTTPYDNVHAGLGFARDIMEHIESKVIRLELILP